MVIKTIIFDLGGVCLSEYLSKKERISLAEKFNLDYLRLEKYHIKNIRPLVTGIIGEKEYLEMLFKEQNKEPLVDEAIAFLRSKNYSFQEVFNLISDLKKNYKIVALTNEIKEAAQFRIEKFKLKDYFSKIFVSSVIGKDKIQPDTFKYIVEDLRISPSETIFIDNNK